MRKIKEEIMSRRFIRTKGVLLISVFILSCCSVSFAQSLAPIKESLFQPADEALKTAKDRQADNLAPKTFLEGFKAYQEAEKDLEKGKKLETIQKKLTEAINFFNQSVEQADLAQSTFKETIEARRDAWEAEASKYASEDWLKAEELFKDALVTLEDKYSQKRAKVKGEEAKELYRKAELDAIKINYLQGAWALLKNAEDLKVKKYAPKTLEKAQRLTKEAEEMLERNRYETKDVKKLAKEAKYEANHAIYLARLVKDAEDADKTLEDIYLASEDPLKKIGESLDKSPGFDQGVDVVVVDIVSGVNNLKQEKERLSETVKNMSVEIAKVAQSQQKTESEKDKIIIAKDNEIETLNQQITQLNQEKKTLQTEIAGLQQDMKQSLVQLKTEKIELKTELEEQKKRKDRIDQIKGMIRPQEGSVKDVDGNVVISLYGLTFPQGQSIIQPQYFSLLSKVLQTIDMFPDSRIIIEGHTDSVGNDTANLKLSNERAIAVKEYVKANSTIPESRIEAVGYGETKPVSTNDTEEGRAKNRRIDVIIKPSK